MPTITFSLKDLQHLVGKKLSIEEVQELAHFGKGDFEGYDENSDEVKIDFGDTNLPYLWSVEGFARLIKGVLGTNKGVPKIEIQGSDYDVIVDKSVMKTRPYIACFIAKCHMLNDYLLKQIVQLQEKFCETYGRKRQKVSIGLYSYKRLSFPVHYRAVDPISVQFVPLDFKAKKNLKEILAEHPKGKEYSWILDGFEKYPVLMDSKDEIMSMVPIINSSFTGKLEIGDDSMLFEATGTDQDAVNLAANIFAYALYDRGFKIYSCSIDYKGGKTKTPHFFNETIKIGKDSIKDIFGLDLSQADIKALLNKAQFDIEDGIVKIPPYRKDIMHPRDVIEDIGIMYGFDKIEELDLKTSTTGSLLESTEFIKKIREILSGLMYQEIMSAILTNKSHLYEKMCIEDFGTVEIEDYMSETYSVVRSWMIPNLMEVLSKNKHVEFPQRIFEEGIINFKEKEIFEIRSLGIASSHEKANYTEMRQALDYIMRCLGLHLEFEELNHKSFIDGRCARALLKGRQIAILGEISPLVIENWKIEMPVAAMEIDLSELFRVVSDISKKK